MKRICLSRIRVTFSSHQGDLCFLFFCSHLPFEHVFLFRQVFSLSLSLSLCPPSPYLPLSLSLSLSVSLSLSSGPEHDDQVAFLIVCSDGLDGDVQVAVDLSCQVYSPTYVAMYVCMHACIYNAVGSLFVHPVDANSPSANIHPELILPYCRSWRSSFPTRVFLPPSLAQHTVRFVPEYRLVFPSSLRTCLLVSAGDSVLVRFPKAS